MYRYTVEERVFIVRTYWKTESPKTCQQEFLKKFGGRHPPSKTCILALSKKLETTGTLLDAHGGGRPKMSEQTVQNVTDRLLQSPNKSLRRLAEESGLSKSTCHRALKQAKFAASKSPSALKQTAMQRRPERKHKARNSDCAPGRAEPDLLKCGTSCSSLPECRWWPFPAHVVMPLPLSQNQPESNSSKSTSEIPVIDFSVYSLNIGDADDEKLQEMCKELQKAFTEVGFVYLKNTGIDQEEVDCVMNVSKKFFLLPEEKKSPFKRGTYKENVNHGWVSSEMESLNPRRPGDLKEAFNITSINKDINWPSDDVEDFQDIKVRFFLRCKELALRVLRVMALSLGLNSDVFLTAHRHIGTDRNGTTLRSLYYPAVQAEVVKEGQVRCGEHSDYGSITFVFQSHKEGLQVQSRDGAFISAPAFPGTVLINIADLMQRWTSDQFTSAVHRVLLPASNDLSTRQSLAFFVQPDNDAIISCVDGSNKYPPVNSMDYLKSRFKETYDAK